MPLDIAFAAKAMESTAELSKASGEIVEVASKSEIIQEFSPEMFKPSFEISKENRLETYDKKGGNFKEEIKKEFAPENFENKFSENFSKETAENVTVENVDTMERTSTFEEQTIDNFKLEEKRSELNLEFGVEHDSKVLRKNLDEAIGQTSDPEISRAHHIVGEKTPEAAKKLEEFGIDRNDPANGILLPNDAESPLKGSLHLGGHTQEYYNTVEQRMMQATTREEALEVLQSLKEDLYSGELPLHNEVKPNK